MSRGGRTNYAENSCRLIGEGDLYGVGVRVSYYLFFFATLIAILSRTLSSSPARKTGPIGRCAEAINILTFAILVVLIRNTREGSFAALEWFLTYPTILVTFISLCFALPIWDNAGILLCYGVTLCLLSVCQPWLYWRRMYQGSKAECEVRYWFFGERNFFGQVWVTFFRVISILACIGGVVLFSLAAAYAFRKKIVRLEVLLHLAEPKAPRDKQRGTRSNNIRMGFKLFGIAFLLFVGAVTMRMTEMTIQLNEIDLSEAPLDSTSQMIPFLTGLLSFLSTLYACTPFSSIIRRLVFGKEYASIASPPSEGEDWVRGQGPYAHAMEAPSSKQGLAYQRGYPDSE
ncbi:hypothetical protein QBC34DRAFT_331879 [Podospora aff. communis PSN243]|uniref:Uncharacterized protein n=1 Tax=Podospora aff. communis PSN243 TaxID=3040156 RepID=A0AAV9GDZ9_9PEZI|nr:hypothetical protein QBC34DRAFT_331879 [Podospora aff. communis PSN243]